MADDWRKWQVVGGALPDSAAAVQQATPIPPEAQNAPGTVYRNIDGQSRPLVGEYGTSETPDQLRARGLRQQADGLWVEFINPTYGDTATKSPDLTNSIEADKSTGLQRAEAWARSVVESGPVPFMDEGIAKLVSMTKGVPYDEVRQVQQEQRTFDKENHAISDMAGTGTGIAVGFAAPGAGYIRGAEGLGAVGRAAQVGAGYGALYGLGAGEGSLMERAPGGVAGAVLGAGIGGGAQAGANALGRRIAGIAGAGSRPVPVRGDPVTRGAIRVANSLDPNAVAERTRLTDLGLDPSVLDVGGGTTERLVRTAAGPAGEGANAAVANAGARQANLRPEVISRTRDLLPDQRSAEAIRTGLEEARDALATVEYGPAYESAVALTPEAARALRGPDGQAAIRRAMLGARANGDVETLAEMESLIGADLDALPTVTGRTLDRVRIAMRDMGQNFMRGERPDRVRAAGYAGRVSGIDDALDSAPGLTDARAAFRERSGAIDAIDNRPDIFTTDPRDFSSWVQGLTPDQRAAATAGVRQDIMDTLGRQRNAGAGSMDTITQSQYSQQNLASLLGEEAATRYLNGITARVQQAQRAARVSPNTNSQTFGRGLDEQAFTAEELVGTGVNVARAAKGDVGAIARLIDGVRARALSAEERNAIVQIGLGSARDLERVVMLADRARARGERLPREVIRFIEATETKLGQPVAAALLSSLKPPSAIAAEDPQQQ